MLNRYTLWFWCEEICLLWPGVRSNWILNNRNRVYSFTRGCRPMQRSLLTSSVLLLTVRQRSCGKVMFSQVFVCSEGGGKYPLPYLLTPYLNRPHKMVQSGQYATYRNAFLFFKLRPHKPFSCNVSLPYRALWFSPLLNFRPLLDRVSHVGWIMHDILCINWLLSHAPAVRTTPGSITPHYWIMS